MKSLELNNLITEKDTLIAQQKARAKRDALYKATRSHMPYLKAEAVLSAVRAKSPLVTRYSKFKHIWNPVFTPTGSHRKCRWVENTDDAGLRFVGFADELIRLNQTGWYADQWQDETYRGAVWQIPARNGCAQYLAGYVDSMNENAALLDMDIIIGTRGFHSTYGDHDDALIDAARDADSFAEHMAEESREFYLKDMAEQRAEELREEAKDLRSDLCDTITEQREKISALLSKAQNVLDEPWQLVR